MTILDDLLRIGFQPITDWVIKGDKIRLRTLKWQEHGGWLYVFAVDGNAVYIGLTDRVLRSRMDEYRYMKQSQTTRVREAIAAELNAGRIVQVFGRRMPEREQLASEERRLREKYRLPWNLI